MNELVNIGFTMRNASRLSGYPRSLLYYRQRERNAPLDTDLKSKIEGIITQRPSYGTRRVTAMIRRSGLIVNRKKVRRHMREMNLPTAIKEIQEERPQNPSRFKTKHLLGNRFY